jgi:hypothetical protein
MTEMTPRERNLAEIGLIALRHGITRQDILSSSRAPVANNARQHCYWHFHSKGWGPTAIGRLMNRNHKSVIHGRKKHMERNGIYEDVGLHRLAGYSEGLV